MALANLSTIAKDCYIGGSFYIMWWLAGDGSMKTGYVCGAHASNDSEVIVTQSGTVSPASVAALQADVDIDTALSDGTMYQFYMLGCGTLLRIPHDGSIEAIKKGDPCENTGMAALGSVKVYATPGSIVGFSTRTNDTTEQEWLQLVT